MTDKVHPAVRILRATADSLELSDVDAEAAGVLRNIGLRDENGIWTLDRRDRVRIAFAAVEAGADMETVIASLNWKDFERLVAGILEENGYRCIESFRRRGDSVSKGMEIDVIGVSGSRILTLDAKMWDVRGGKSSALAEAALRQRERTLRLTGMLPRLSERLHLAQGQYHLMPVLVTWLVEELEIHEGVPVVPVFKLNAFLLELDAQDDVFVSFWGEVQF